MKKGKEKKIKSGKELIDGLLETPHLINEKLLVTLFDVDDVIDLKITEIMWENEYIEICVEKE
jgi:hypothetical protein